MIINVDKVADWFITHIYFCHRMDRFVCNDKIEAKKNQVVDRSINSSPLLRCIKTIDFRGDVAKTFGYGMVLDGWTQTTDVPCWLFLPIEEFLAMDGHSPDVVVDENGNYVEIEMCVGVK